MALLVELAGRTFAVELAGPTPPRPVRGGVLLPPGRVAVLHGFGDTRFYRHGHNSWSPSGWRRLSDPPLRIPGADRRTTADDPVWDDPTRHHSSAVAALDGPDGNVLLLGALGLDVPRLAADRDTLVAWHESARADWFLGYGPEQRVFADYTELLAARFGRGTHRVTNVWCSWYAYYENITEAQLGKDLADLDGLPFDVVQVDDGWEETVGDWRPNAKFPAGMRALADRIQDTGFTPGLWIAPFIALPQSQLARERSDLLLRDQDGRPVIAGHNWGTGYHALDFTRPAALDHLADTIHRVVHDWGFRYLKLDFVNAAAAPGAGGGEVGREEVYRTALQVVRDTAGPDVYLLGSGAILVPSLGILDGLRAGPDVAPMWDNYATSDPSDATARNAVVNTLHRIWQAPLAQVDPDVVYFRSRLNLLTEPQTALLRDLADICGFRAVSDPPGWLTAGELQAMTDYLTSRPRIERLSRYRYTIDGREVDFGPVAGPPAGAQLYPIG